MKKDNVNSLLFVKLTPWTKVWTNVSFDKCSLGQLLQHPFTLTNLSFCIL